MLLAAELKCRDQGSVGVLQQRAAAHCCHPSHAVLNFKQWEVPWMLSQEQGSCRGVTCAAGRSVPARFTLAGVWSETFTTIFTVPVANHCHPRRWKKHKAGEETGGGRTRKRYITNYSLFVFHLFPKN